MRSRRTAWRATDEASWSEQQARAGCLELRGHKVAWATTAPPRSRSLRIWPARRQPPEWSWEGAPRCRPGRVLPGYRCCAGVANPRTGLCVLSGLNTPSPPRGLARAARAKPPSERCSRCVFNAGPRCVPHALKKGRGPINGNSFRRARVRPPKPMSIASDLDGGAQGAHEVGDQSHRSLDCTRRVRRQVNVDDFGWDGLDNDAGSRAVLHVSHERAPRPDEAAAPQRRSRRTSIARAADDPGHSS